MTITNGHLQAQSQQDPARFKVRKALLQDAPQIASVGIRTWTETFGHSVEPHELTAFLEEAYSLEATTKDISDPKKDFFVATTAHPDVNGGEVIAGFALLTRGTTEPCLKHLPTSKTIELQRIYIQSDYQGQGVAKLLSLQLEDIARKEGYTYMWLGVWEENHRAHRVYERFGYNKMGSHDFDVGGNVQLDWIMVKEL